LEKEMLFGRLSIAILLAISASSLCPSCLAQGPATPLEISAVEAAAELIGESPVVRGAIERLLGPSTAKVVLELPARELGWKVIETDIYANAVAANPAIREAGKTSVFLASINDLRAFRAETTPGQKTLDFLSVNERGTIRSVIFEKDLAKQEFSIRPSGIKMSPGYKVPLIETPNTIVNLEVDELKWADLAAGCAILSPCANAISGHLKNVFGPSPGSTSATLPPPAPNSFNVGSNYLFEQTNFGVLPTRQPPSEMMPDWTPLEVPSGTTITTAQLHAFLHDPRQQQTGYGVLLDVSNLGQRSDYSIPSASQMVGAGFGNLSPDQKRLFRSKLDELTRADKERYLIFFSARADSWYSYNAALEAIEAGYKNVFWYRGGRASWQKAYPQEWQKYKVQVVVAGY
jgi:PQQ-dependent catabolism-associated CXXCW motif protein